VVLKIIKSEPFAAFHSQSAGAMIECREHKIIAVYTFTYTVNNNSKCKEMFHLLK
jgi:hypothetical protein